MVKVIKDNEAAMRRIGSGPGEVCGGNDTRLEGIQGPKGDKGDTGEKGEKGDKGENGVSGADGSNGADGRNGLFSKFFKSVELVGTGNLQLVAHGLETVPVLSFILPLSATGNPTYTEGVHNSVSCQVTVTKNAKFRIIALA